LLAGAQGQVGLLIGFTALAISKVRLMIVSPGHNRNKDIMRYKSKHNLLRWFIEDHRTLPASYVKSCQEFFKWLDESNKEGFKAPSLKPEASSIEPRPDDTETSN